MNQNKVNIDSNTNLKEDSIDLDGLNKFKAVLNSESGKEESQREGQEEGQTQVQEQEQDQEDNNITGNPVVDIVKAIVENERARKFGNEEEDIRSYNEYSRCFIEIFGYPPTSNVEQDITLTQLVDKYGSFISKAIEAQTKILSAFIVAQGLFRKKPRKVTIKYVAPAQETINRLKKNLELENSKRSEDKQKYEYIPDKPKEYQLNFPEILSRFKDISRHVEQFKKLAITIIKRGRVANTPDSFINNYRPVYFDKEIKEFFNHPNVLKLVEVRNKDLGEILNLENDTNFKMRGIERGFAMKRTIISTFYNYAHVNNLLRIHLIDNKRFQIGIIFDETLSNCFDKGKNSLFKQLVRNNNAYEGVNVDFTSKVKENINNLMIEAKQNNDISTIESLTKFINMNTNCKFLPIYYVQNLYTKGLVDAHSFVNKDGEIIKVLGGKINEEERTPEMEQLLLADYYQVKKIKDSITRINKDNSDKLLKFSINS